MHFPGGWYSAAVAAISVGVAAVSFFIKFDRNRRSNPDYLKNLVKRRKEERAEKIQNETIVFNDDKEAMTYFMNCVNTGGMLAQNGDFPSAIEYFVNAVVNTGFPYAPFASKIKQLLPSKYYEEMELRISKEIKKRGKRAHGYMANAANFN